MADVKEFLNPKSTLTPGIAGAIAMLASNSLWVAFGLPQAWTALAVSALFGLLVGTGLTAPLWQRGIYLVLNSLVIFSVGIGGNALGTQATQSSSTAQHGSGLFRPLGVTSAHAQQPPPGLSADELKRREVELARKEQELRQREEELRRKESAPERKASPPPQNPASPEPSRKFFQQWKF